MRRRECLLVPQRIGAVLVVAASNAESSIVAALVKPLRGDVVGAHFEPHRARAALYGEAFRRRQQGFAETGAVRAHDFGAGHLLDQVEYRRAC